MSREPRRRRPGRAIGYAMLLLTVPMAFLGLTVAVDTLLPEVEPPVWGQLRMARIAGASQEEVETGIAVCGLLAANPAPPLVAEILQRLRSRRAVFTQNAFTYAHPALPPGPMTAADNDFVLPFRNLPALVKGQLDLATELESAGNSAAASEVIVGLYWLAAQVATDPQYSSYAYGVEALDTIADYLLRHESLAQRTAAHSAHYQPLLRLAGANLLYALARLYIANAPAAQDAFREEGWPGQFYSLTFKPKIIQRQVADMVEHSFRNEPPPLTTYRLVNLLTACAPALWNPEEFPTEVLQKTNTLSAKLSQLAQQDTPLQKKTLSQF